jgi:hypothetical protein
MSTKRGPSIAIRDVAPGKEQRRCRQCDACCTVLAVEEVAKPEFERCDYQGQSKPGCAIYEERPESCRIWSCAWLQGFGTGNDRPDKLGLILDAVETVGGPTVQAREVWHGAFHLPRVQVTIRGFAERVPVVLMYRDGGRKLIGPPGLVRMMVDAANDGTAAAGGGFVPNCEHGIIRSQCRPCMQADLDGGAA